MQQQILRLFIFASQYFHKIIGYRRMVDDAL